MNRKTYEFLSLGVKWRNAGGKLFYGHWFFLDMEMQCLYFLLAMFYFLLAMFIWRDKFRGCGRRQDVFGRVVKKWQTCRNSLLQSKLF